MNRLLHPLGILALLAALSGLALPGCPGDAVDDDDTTPAGDDDDATAADDDDDATAADDDDDAAVEASTWAGTYVIAFHRAGSQFALGSFVVADDGTYATNVASSDGFVVESTGYVEEDGNVVVETLENTAGLDIEVTRGTLHAEGIMDGDYTVGEEEGIIAGSKDNVFTEDERTLEFDGAYELTTLFEGEETASTILIIADGRFDAEFTDLEGDHFEASGYVTSDGTIVLNSIASSQGFDVMAEASIDQDSFELGGLYRIGDNVGEITGRMSD